jgi:hypothetical protein
VGLFFVGIWYLDLGRQSILSISIIVRKTEAVQHIYCHDLKYDTKSSLDKNFCLLALHTGLILTPDSLVTSEKDRIQKLTNQISRPSFFTTF